MNDPILKYCAVMLTLCVVGLALIFTDIYYYTCEDTAVEVLAFEQCLTENPGKCSVGGPEAFAKHHRNKQWMRANGCPFIGR